MPDVKDQVIEAPPLPASRVKDDKWAREERAFFLQLAELLKTQRGKWVAMHNGQVAESGDSMRQVLQRVRDRYPKTEIYVQLVDENLPVGKMLSPRKPRW